jgi:hypothetical protein
LRFGGFRGCLFANSFLKNCSASLLLPQDVQYVAGHVSPTITRVYDRRRRNVIRNIVERISIEVHLMWAFTLLEKGQIRMSA